MNRLRAFADADFPKTNKQPPVFLPQGGPSIPKVFVLRLVSWFKEPAVDVGRRGCQESFISHCSMLLSSAVNLPVVGRVSATEMRFKQRKSPQRRQYFAVRTAYLMRDKEDVIQQRATRKDAVSLATHSRTSLPSDDMTAAAKALTEQKALSSVQRIQKLTRFADGLQWRRSRAKERSAATDNDSLKRPKSLNASVEEARQKLVRAKSPLTENTES